MYRLLFLILILFSNLVCGLERIDFDQAMNLSFSQKIYLKLIEPKKYKLYHELRDNYYNNLELHEVIPKKLHFFKEDNQEFFINSCSLNNPNYLVKKWDLAKSEQNKNLVKLRILNKEGGIFIEKNTQCLKNFDTLLNFNFFISVNNIENRIEANMDVIGSKPTNKILEDLIESYSALKNDLKESLLYKLAQKTNIKNHNIILPSIYFNPLYKKALKQKDNNDLDSYFAMRSDQTITFNQNISHSRVNYSPFLLELANGNYLKRIWFKLFFHNNENYALLRKIYKNNFPTLVPFNKSPKTPLVFHIICLEKKECDSFLGNNLDFVAINNEHAFKLWSQDALLIYENNYRSFLSKASNSNTKKKMLALLILAEKGGVFVSDKLTPNHNLFELCNKYDLFLGSPQIHGFFGSIKINSDIIASKANHLFIKNTLNDLKKEKYITEENIENSLLNNLNILNNKNQKNIILPGRYFFATENGDLNFTSFKKNFREK